MAVAILVLFQSVPMYSLEVYAEQTEDEDQGEIRIEELTKTPDIEWSNQDVIITGKIKGGKSSQDTPYRYKYTNNKDMYRFFYKHDTYEESGHVIAENAEDQTIHIPIYSSTEATYYIWAYDGKKNKSDLKVIDVKVDKEAPTVESIHSDADADPTGKDVTISGKASDAHSGSGLKEIRYGVRSITYEQDTFETKADKVYTASVEEDGSYSFVLDETVNGDLYVWAYDQAGNKTVTPQMIRVNIDKTSPIINKITDTSGGSWTNGGSEQTIGWGKDKVTVNIDAELLNDTNKFHTVTKVYYGISDNLKLAHTIKNPFNGQFTFEVPAGKEGVDETYYIWAENAIDCITKVPIPYKIQIDNHTPEIVSYEFSPLHDNLASKFIRWLTGGIFCKEGVKVTVTATDEDQEDDDVVSSGMESITLYGDDKGQSGVSVIGEATGDSLVKQKNGTVKASFDIAGKEGEVYRKVLSAKAKDVAGNESSVTKPSDIDEEKGDEIVVEKTSPTIQIEKKKTGAYKEVGTGDIYYHGEASFDLSISDVDSGLQSVEVMVNGKNIKNDSNQQTILTEKESKDNKTVLDHVEYTVSTGSIPAEEGGYRIQVRATDNAGNTGMETCEAKQDITPPEITKISFAPHGTDIKHPGIIRTVDYGYFFQKDTTVILEAKDNETGSGVDKISYYTVDYSFNKKGVPSGWKEADVIGNKIRFEIKAGFKGKIFAYAKDKVGEKSKTVSPNAVIIESLEQHQKDAKLTMTIPEKVSGKDQAGNDLYQGDVTVDCAFGDRISGLAKVTYQVEEVDTGNVTQEETIVIEEDGTIRQGSAQIVEKDENLVTALAKRIKVTNNRNNIKVRAVLTDRAGYETREERKFSIDKTAPVLVVTYDNNSYDKEFEAETEYYKEGRTATITVTERNFNEADAKVTVTNSEGSAPSISGWTKHENRQDPDQTTYTATIPYQQEGDYTFAMSFEDLAGHQQLYQQRRCPYGDHSL